MNGPMAHDERGSRPVPDPTVLTTEALHREIAALKELVGSWMDSREQIVAEKFASVAEQLDLVERQRVEQKSDTKAAVDAALTAQKEAVKEQTTASERAIAKSEASTTKQLEQLSTTFTTAVKGVTDSLDDLKERVSRFESVTQGRQEGIGLSANVLATLAGLALTVVGLVAAIYFATH